MTAAPASSPSDEESLRAQLLEELRRTTNELTAPRGASEATAAWDRLRKVMDKATAPKRAPSSRALDVAGILAGWRDEGPLVHEPTGLDALDEATGGGPVYGSRWYILGAPDAAKTAFVVQTAHVYAARGIAVGLLAVDEEPGDMLTRLAQRVGFDRKACEVREPGALEAIARHLGHLPIRFYGLGWTIEGAGRDLAAFAAEHTKGRAMLGIDSIQAVRCEGEALAERELSEVQAIGARVAAVRAVASAHRLIALATSEMSRPAYRAVKKHDRIDPLAGAKWSGAVEYSARVMLSLHSIKGHADTIEVQIPKNKHGRRRYSDEDAALYLQIDLARQRIEECDKPEQGDDEGGRDQRTAEREARVEAKAKELFAALVKARAKGRDVTSRSVLAKLVSGDSGVKSEAISLLLADGRVTVEGRGKPYVPRLNLAPSDEDGQGGSE